MLIFGIKLEYRCTNRNSSLCNGTIIVLKITLLHSVSVITTFSSTAGARPTIPTILGVVIEKVCTIIAPLTFFDPVSSFTAGGCWKFVGKCLHWGKMLIT